MHTRSQEFARRQYTVKDGLPGSIVYHALQDNNGFIWFATNQGVSRFDGNTFRNFSKEDGLPDNEILRLYLDRYHNLWCVSFVGIPAVYYNGGFHRFNDCKGVFDVIDDFVTDSISLMSIYEKEGQEYRGYYRSASLPGQWQFTKYAVHADKGSEDILVPKISSPKKISFYSSGGILRNSLVVLRQAGKVFDYTFPKFTDVVFPFTRKSLCCLMPNQSSFLFIADSLYIVGDSRTKNNGRLNALPFVEDYHSKGDDLNALYAENDSTLWLCTRNRGLLRIKNFQSRDLVVQSFFPDIFCTSILKDREGGYWVTTHSEGVYYLPNLSAFYMEVAGKRPVKDAKCIRSIGQGKLVAGLADGNILLVDGTQRKGRFLSQQGPVYKNNRVMDILPYGHRGFWIASDYGLILHSANGGETRIGPILWSGIKALFPASDTSLFFGGVHGIFYINPVTGYAKNISSNRTTCIAGNYQACYWGTLNGMYALENDSTHYLGRQYPLLNGIINHIDVAPDSAIWVSTQQGIVILRQGQVSTIQQGQGLLSNMCKHVLFRGSTAWVSTDKGISRVVYRRSGCTPVYTISNITEDDGLLSNDVNQTALSGDYIWAATGSGISYFTADYAPHSIQTPLININAITGGAVQKTMADTVLIDYKKNKLLIELSGISFHSGKQIRYEYRLKDLDSNWTNTNNHLLEFYTLPFGTHVFEVKAVDRWGIKSDHAKTLVILVPPPFWKTGWFTFFTYFFTALLIGGLAYLYFYRQQRQKDREFWLEKRMAELELMALRAQMNPHFIFNCINSIDALIQSNDKYLATVYLNKFARLIRNILDSSKQNTIALARDLETLQLYIDMEQFRNEDKFTAEIQVDDQLLEEECRVPPLIIQPYVENAILHGLRPRQGSTGKLTIRVCKEDEYLVYRIEDNGVGRAATASRSSHRSYGMEISRDRVNLFNRQEHIPVVITDLHQDGRPAGTSVQVSLKIS